MVAITVELCGSGPNESSTANAREILGNGYENSWNCKCVGNLGREPCLGIYGVYPRTWQEGLGEQLESKKTF